MEPHTVTPRQAGNRYLPMLDASSSPQNTNFSLHKSIVWCVTILLTIFSLNAAYALSAEKTLKKFYANVDNKRCLDAVKMRPEYSLEHCENLDRIFIHRIEVQAEDKNHAVALLEVDVEADGKNQYFIGYTQLQKVGKRWMIIGPYKSKFSYDLDDYISEFVPDGISKNKSVKKSHKKKKETTASVARELPPGDAVSETVSKDFKESKKSVSSKNSPEPLLASGKKTSTSEHKTLEAYMAGHMPIEGRFNIILKTLRELFPEFTGSIMLADKSQRLLYFYNDNNILGGFYPLLNASVSIFPQGIYRIKSVTQLPQEEGEELDQQLLLTDSIIMEKMVLKDDDKVFISDFFYLRSFFDSDQKNSLLLSPIDYKKLKQLIQTETLLYIAK